MYLKGKLWPENLKKTSYQQHFVLFLVFLAGFTSPSQSHGADCGLNHLRCVRAN